jgi:hypothetical protein
MKTEFLIRKLIFPDNPDPKGSRKNQFTSAR